jgi:hypothetical protein
MLLLALVTPSLSTARHHRHAFVPAEPSGLRSEQAENLIDALAEALVDVWRRLGIKLSERLLAAQ